MELHTAVSLFSVLLALFWKMQFLSNQSGCTQSSICNQSDFQKDSMCTKTNIIFPGEMKKNRDGGGIGFSDPLSLFHLFLLAFKDRKFQFTKIFGLEILLNLSRSKHCPDTDVWILINLYQKYPSVENMWVMVVENHTD